MPSNASLTVYEVTTRNDAVSTDNRMHSDDVAQRYGFSGALVPGVTVFGHMTKPLVEFWGEDWLARGCGDLRLIKPAYHGDRLTITMTENDAPQPAPDATGGAQPEHTHIVRTHNEAGVLLATLTAGLPDVVPAANPLAHHRAGPAVAPDRADRPEIKRDRIVLDAALPTFSATASMADNRSVVELLSDPLAGYLDEGRNERAVAAHPMFFARLLNRAFTEQWLMPAWIHVGSTFQFHRAIRLGQTVTVQAIPTARWDHRKGHEFATLYVAMSVAGELVAEADHTAIYQPAERAQLS